ncbi:olfactory receptor 5B12-like [Pelodytes ibericus]
MGNQTLLSELYLSGLSDLPDLQLPLLLIFTCIYLMTLGGNLLILGIIVLDSHLHSPMYLFLCNLACMDMTCASVTAPRLLFDLCTQSRMISYPACISQVYFFIFIATCEILLLAVMSYDRYIAICKPLHYMQLMNCKACAQLLTCVWATGAVYSLIHALLAARLTFCRSLKVHSFFCDLPKLFEISCSDTFFNVLVIFVPGGLLALLSIMVTFVPYIYIFLTVVKIKPQGTQHKALSTCSSHLTVVFIFYGTVSFNYLRPSSHYYYAADKLVSVFYTTISPLLNPIIYSLRNQELKAALGRVLLNVMKCL